MNAAQPMVSVVIVSWNARQYLKQCLESLSARACRFPMEVLVVDNDSSDGSADMVEKDYPNCRLLRNETNLGFAKANNIGIKASTGRYVCLVNSDVRVLPDCITKLVDYCEAHAEVGMAGPRILGGDGKLQRSCRGFPTLWNMFCRSLALDSLFPSCRLFGGYLMPYWEHDTLEAVDILSGCFWIVRREALPKVGLLDEKFFMYGEDMDWCKRFRAGDWRIAFVPEAEAIHYGGASSANAPIRFFIEKQRADLQYWAKHHGCMARHCFFLISCLHHALRVLAYTCACYAARSRAEERRFKVRRSLRCLRWLLSPAAITALIRREVSE